MMEELIGSRYRRNRYGKYLYIKRKDRIYIYYTVAYLLVARRYLIGVTLPTTRLVPIMLA